jgi:hypothetical protein
MVHRDVKPANIYVCRMGLDTTSSRSWISAWSRCGADAATNTRSPSIHDDRDAGVHGAEIIVAGRSVWIVGPTICAWAAWHHSAHRPPRLRGGTPMKMLLRTCTHSRYRHHSGPNSDSGTSTISCSRVWPRTRAARPQTEELFTWPWGADARAGISVPPGRGGRPTCRT